MPTVLITGASRGLGLEFVRQYAADGWRVIAAARDPAHSEPLAALARAGDVRLHALDVADHAAIEALARTLAGESIDVLINNAGLMGGVGSATDGARAQVFGRTDYAEWERVLRVNVLAPMKMSEAFVEHLAAGGGGKIVTLSSVLGSIGGNAQGGLYVYRTSKSAVNALMRSMALDLAPRGILAVAVHPGWVSTDMGGARAPLKPEASIAGLRQLIARLGPAESGRFWRYDGEEIPW